MMVPYLQEALINHRFVVPQNLSEMTAFLGLVSMASGTLLGALLVIRFRNRAYVFCGLFLVGLSLTTLGLVRAIIQL